MPGTCRLEIKLSLQKSSLPPPFHLLTLKISYPFRVKSVNVAFSLH